VNKLSEEVAKLALSDLSLYKSRVKLLLEEREKLKKTLAAEPYVKRVLPRLVAVLLVCIRHFSCCVMWYSMFACSIALMMV
jgi:histidinol-phosphate/aromatic aminotransferase/cobyric acid decarboxylase-like protein